MTRRVVTLLRQRNVDVRDLEALENRDARIEVSTVERASSALGADGVFDEDTYDAAGRVMMSAPTLSAGRVVDAGFIELLSAAKMPVAPTRNDFS